MYESSLAKHLYPRYPLVCSSQTVKGVRAQGPYLKRGTTPHLKKTVETPPACKLNSTGTRPFDGVYPERSRMGSGQALRGHKLYLLYLYQISHLHVKKNLEISQKIGEIIRLFPEK